MAGNIYLHSQTLDRDVKYMPDNELAVVNEKNSMGRNIIYTMDELRLLDGAGQFVTEQLHLIKKVFSGTIIEHEDKK
jgi:hypothetical protein